MLMANNQSDLGIEFKYLIVNEMDRRFGLWVNTVGLQAIPPNSPYPLKDHPSGYFSMPIKAVCYANTSWFT